VARQTAVSSDFTSIHSITGLEAETRYYYRVYVDGQLQPMAVHSFQTFSPMGVTRNFSFAVAADVINVGTNPTVGAPVYAALAADDPLFMLQIGDFDHRNPGGLIQMRTMHRQVLGPSTATGADFDRYIAPNMAVFHVWDDHDYGMNNGDKTFAGRTAALQAYREYYATPTLPNPAGIWHSFGAGQIDVMMLDVRSQRDPVSTPDGPGKSMLDGDNISNGQKAWLKAALLNSTATWKFIVTPVTFNPTTKPADAWGGYATERNEIVNFIRMNNISGVIFVSGDLHSGGAIDNGANAGFPEVSVPHTNLNTNQKASGPAGTWSEGLITGIGNPGYVLITVSGSQATLQVKGIDGLVKKSLTLSTTTAKPEFDVVGGGVAINDGDTTPSGVDGTDFGSAAIGTSSITRTFTIKNTGAAALQLTGTPRVQVSGAAASDFAVTVQPAASILPGSVTTFQVKFTPSAAGLRAATLTIVNNDSNENPYNFSISGTGASQASQWIIDDGDAGFSTVGAWGIGTPAGTYQEDQRYSAKGIGADKASWTVGNLPAGAYEVFTCWAGSGTTNRASNAPYAIYDGANALATVLVNQQVRPGSVTLGGVPWHRLGSFNVTSGTLKVVLSDNANGYVFADALRVVRLLSLATTFSTQSRPGELLTSPIILPLAQPQTETLSNLSARMSTVKLYESVRPARRAVAVDSLHTRPVWSSRAIEIADAALEPTRPANETRTQRALDDAFSAVGLVGTTALQRFAF
jgi:alkaline phosphatase D